MLRRVYTQNIDGLDELGERSASLAPSLPCPTNQPTNLSWAQPTFPGPNQPTKGRGRLRQASNQPFLPSHPRHPYHPYHPRHRRRPDHPHCAAGVPRDKLVAVHGSMARAQCEFCQAECPFSRFQQQVRESR